MRNQITFVHSIRGYLVGSIWMPAAECYKHVTYDVTREDARFNEPLTLREHVLRATNDGDFQACQLADAVLLTVATIARDGKTYQRKRVRDLTTFPSIADCVKTDWCGPEYDE